MDLIKKYYTPYLIDLLPMRDEIKIELYMKKVRTLPQSLINTLIKSETADFLEDDLGPSFKLPEDKIENLTRIIRDVILADLFIGNMTSEIGKRLNLDQNTAQQIRDRIIGELFAPAIEDIKKVQREKFSSKPAMSAAPTNINPNNVVNLRDK